MGAGDSMEGMTEHPVARGVEGRGIIAFTVMQGTFSAGVDEITWVITSYLVANAVILPITGWLSRRFGRKRFYLACLTLFTLASLGSGAAPNIAFLIVMRVIQGLAGGGMVPMSQAILLESFPPEEHGKAMALSSGRPWAVTSPIPSPGGGSSTSTSRWGCSESSSGFFSLRIRPTCDGRREGWTG